MRTVEQIIRSIEMEKSCGPSRDEACFGNFFPERLCTKDYAPLPSPATPNPSDERAIHLERYEDSFTGEYLYRRVEKK